MAERPNDLPIFFDGTRRRWKRLKLWTLVIITVLLGLAVTEGYRVLSVGTFENTPDALISPRELADDLAHRNTPVIGEGPLARVLKVEGSTVSEVYNPEKARTLSSQEQTEVGSYRYVIEKYGAQGNGKRLVLTFDDGPDPLYTPQILDLLSKESVHATFFVIGNKAIEQRSIVERIVREGHSVANHSFTHADIEELSSFIAQQEINLTRRTLRVVSGHDTTFVRPPYSGISDQSLRDGLHGLLESQQQGLTVALYDFDTDDWRHKPGDKRPIELPILDGRDQVLLLHDSGGDRSETVVYLQKLIAEAKKQGYSFVPMHALYPEKPEYYQVAAASADDIATVMAFEAVTIWPLRVTWAIFAFTIIIVFIGMIVYVVLAIIEKRRTRSFSEIIPSKYRPSVTVIIPAYNEEKVLASCVKGILRSNYNYFRIIIVDDGSIDKTARVANRLAKKYKSVTAYTKPNAGKAQAINFALKRTRSPIIISIDADTVFQPDTITRMVRHFKDYSVGAVAGMVEVGNNHNILARCQALEYSTSICLERTAQAYLNAIMVVPGACGAWRRQAVVEAGRYTSLTLAEDCDITLAVHTAGYQVIQDNTAISYTEAPLSLRDFARQRFRWAFGNIQVYWRHRKLLTSRERTWLNTFILPLAIISTIGPIVFLPLLGWLTLQNIISGQFVTLGLFLAVSLTFHFTRAFIALRIGKQSMRHLLYVPVARLLYGPMRIYLLYGTLLRAIRGDAVGWSKLERNGLDILVDNIKTVRGVRARARQLSQANH